MKHLSAAAALLTLGLLPCAARAHGVELLVERRGAEVVVRATHHGEHPLADASYEVRSPASPAAPWASGRTDRAGALAFVPDAPGTWSVRIVESGGHGGVVKVEVPAAPAVDPGAAAPALEPAAPAPPAPRPPAGALLRTLAGVAVIGAVFAALLVVQRRRRAAGRR